MRSQPIPVGLMPELTRLLQFIINDRRINTGPAQPLVIASNTIRIPANFSYFSIASSGASTDLNNILGATDGDVVFFKIANNSNAIVFKHTGGNIICNGAADLTISSVNSLVLGIYDGILSKWKCILFTIG